MYDAIHVKVYEGQDASGTYSEDNLLWSHEFSRVHVGNGQLSIVQWERLDYLLLSNLWGGQGTAGWNYEVFSLNASGEKQVIDKKSVEFEMNEGSSAEGYGEFQHSLEQYITDGTLIIACDIDMGQQMVRAEGSLYMPQDYYREAFSKYDDMEAPMEELGIVESVPENLITQENGNTQIEKKTTISGSFTVIVRDVIPDYTLYDDVPTVAVVTEFQGGPFTLYVGEEIGRQLKKDETYVFTIQPFEVDETKEEIQFKTLASIVQEYDAKFTVVDFRLAEEHETGVDSLNLTIV